MHPLEAAIPELDVLLGLEPEELAADLLVLMKAHPSRFGGSNGRFHPNNLSLSLREQIGGSPPYGGRKVEQVDQAIREAYGSLRNQNLIIDAGTTNGWVELSRRAEIMSTTADYQRQRVAKLLPRETVHAAISGDVWIDFMRGRYDIAVFVAMKAVEVALRKAVSAPQSDTAVAVARKAFQPGRDARDGKEAIPPGPLTDREPEGGERQATMDLFAGALGALKNPHSHRDVNLDDPTEAASVIMFASYLLRVIDARIHRLEGRP